MFFFIFFNLSFSIFLNNQSFATFLFHSFFSNLFFSLPLFSLFFNISFYFNLSFSTSLFSVSPLPLFSVSSVQHQSSKPSHVYKTQQPFHLYPNTHTVLQIPSSQSLLSMLSPCHSFYNTPDACKAQCSTTNALQPQRNPASLSISSPY